VGRLGSPSVRLGHSSVKRGPRTTATHVTTGRSELEPREQRCTWRRPAGGAHHGSSAHRADEQKTGQNAAIASNPQGPAILVEREPPVALLRLNRPDKLNAISAEVIGSLEAHLAAIAADDAIRAAVLTGDQRAFAAGADVTGMPDPDGVPAFVERWRSVLRFPEPLVAGVSGHGLGGGFELALMCDVILAAESARFGLPETGLGLLPGAGGTQLLPRTVGRSLAAEMILGGRVLTAEEAVAHGVASRVVPTAELEGAALALARTMAAKAPLAVRRAKAALVAARERPLAEGLAVECAAFADLLRTEDWAEGRAALAERRPPSFSGR
jgi:enoyl-CoA hydratase